jgi:hypothetical protein
VILPCGYWWPVAFGSVKPTSINSSALAFRVRPSGFEVRDGKQEPVVADATRQHVFFDLGADLGTELETPGFPVLGVLLDEETFTSWVEPRDELHCHSPDGKNAGREVDVDRTQLDQFAPAKPAFDVDLDEKTSGVVGVVVVDVVELLRRHDRPQLLRYGRRLDTTARMQLGDRRISLMPPAANRSLGPARHGKEDQREHSHDQEGEHRWAPVRPS